MLAKANKVTEEILDISISIFMYVCVCIWGLVLAICVSFCSAQVGGLSVCCWVAVWFVLLATMEFDLDKFAGNPTLQQLNKCKKIDLMLITNLFNVQTPLVVRKEELRRLIAKALGERGLLADAAGIADVEPLAPVPTPSTSPAVTTSIAPPSPAVGDVS